MSRRKLKVVEYDRDYIDYEDENDVKRLLATMEEMHFGIRGENWPAELLDQKDNEKSREEIRKYLKEIGVPDGCATAGAIDFVLNAAIDRIYSRNEAIKTFSLEEFRRKTEELLNLQKDQQNPLNRLDYTSDLFAERARSICGLLGLSIAHPDAKVLMKAACLFIVENLNENVLELENSPNWEKPKTLNIKEFPLGMASPKNGAVMFSTRVLRLINIRQLQEIQTKINETLVEIQNLTIDMGKKANLSQVQYGR